MRSLREGQTIVKGDDTFVCIKGGDKATCVKIEDGKLSDNKIVFNNLDGKAFNGYGIVKNVKAYNLYYEKYKLPKHEKARSKATSK